MQDTVFDILQIVFADIILSGDNALVIGMAAASLSPELRKKAIFWGMALAAILRIIFCGNRKLPDQPAGDSVYWRVNVGVGLLAVF